MNVQLSRVLLGLGLVSSLTLLPSHAAPVTGKLNITGDAQVAATFLNFLCNPTLPGCPAGFGNFATSTIATGDFVPYESQDGLIHSISQAGQPINTPFSLPNFLTFTTGPADIALDLNFVFEGTFGQASCGAPAAAGQTCTPIIPGLITAANPLGLSAFNLANTQDGSTASFSVAGNARRISTGEISPFSGIFTAQFTSTPGTTDQSFQALLAAVSTGGSLPSAYSATFNAFTPAVTTPEPGTMAIMLGGMALLAFASIRRRSKA